MIKYVSNAFPPSFQVVQELTQVCNTEINHTDDDGYSALMHAAINYTTPVQVFKHLIQQGANVKTASNMTGWTALCWAVYHDHPIEVLEVLCEAGSEVNKLNTDRSSIFYWINRERDDYQ